MIKFYISKIFRKIFLTPAVRGSELHPTARVGSGSAVTDSKIGKYSYIGDNSCVSMAKIGSFTSISSFCSIGGGAHPIDWVSTSPVFTSSRSILRTNFTQNKFATHKETVIGNDVWIGTHCLIKSGVRIADGAIVGMGSVVTKDVGPYEIWAGNPARLIRKRFDEATIQLIIDTKWWLWDDDTIKKAADSFNNVESFLEVIGEHE